MIIASEDMNVSELQVEGLLAMVLMLVTVAPVCVLAVLGTARAACRCAMGEHCGRYRYRPTQRLVVWPAVLSESGVHGPELLNLMTKGL